MRILVESIPGASALTVALSLSGFNADNFLFLGFLPHKKGKETLLKEIIESKRTIAFFESTHRIIKSLEKLNNLGYGWRWWKGNKSERKKSRK